MRRRCSANRPLGSSSRLRRTNVTRVLEQAAAAGVPARVIGQTGGNRLRIATGGRMTIDMAIEDAERAWSAAIDSYFAKKIA